MKKKILVLDAGHGSNTKGRQSPDGCLNEFNNNRIIVRELSQVLAANNIKHFVILRQWIDPAQASVADLSLSARVAFINSLIHTNNPEDYLSLSLHSNASTMQGWGEARGVGTYYSKVNTKLATVAAAFSREISQATGLPVHGTGAHCPGLMMTGSKIRCDSLLFEIGFHDNRKDMEIMKQKEHARRAALGIFSGLQKLVL